MVLIVMIASGVIIFYGKTSSHLIGLLIGISAMLTQLLFVIMIVFFIYSEHASNSSHGKTLLFHFKPIPFYLLSSTSSCLILHSFFTHSFLVFPYLFPSLDHSFYLCLDLKSSDRAMGTFALFLMLMMGTWTTVLWFCKDEIISNRQSLPQSDTQPLHVSKSSSSSQQLSPSAPPTSSVIYSSTRNQDELPLHQQDDVVDVDLEDEESF